MKITVTVVVFVRVTSLEVLKCQTTHKSIQFHHSSVKLSFYSFAPLGIVATKQIGESPPLDNHCSDSYVLTGNRFFNLQ